MRPDGVHVGVVPLAFLGVVTVRDGGPVAVGQEEGGEVGDEGEAEHGDGAAHPAQLRDAPRERQHAGADHGSDDVREAGPYVACRRPSVTTTTTTRKEREEEIQPERI